MMLSFAPESTTREIDKGTAKKQSPCRRSHEMKSFDGPWMNGLLSKEVRHYPTVLDYQGERDEVSASRAAPPLNVELRMSSYSNDDTVETADTTLTASTQGVSCGSSEERVSRFAPLVSPVLAQCGSASTQGIFRVSSYLSPPKSEGSSSDEEENMSSMFTLKRANPIYDSEDEDDCYDDEVVDGPTVSKRRRLNSSEPTGPFAPVLAADLPLRTALRVGSLLDSDSSTCTPINFEEKLYSQQSRELFSKYKTFSDAKQFDYTAARQAIHSTSRNQGVHRCHVQVGARTA